MSGSWNKLDKNGKSDSLTNLMFVLGVSKEAFRLKCGREILCNSIQKRKIAESATHERHGIS
jgi:hypothetical protein